MRLGIIIPYYKNSGACEDNFKLLMEVLDKQLTDNIILYIYEDGQYSSWLEKYSRNNICITYDEENRGVSHARNCGLDFILDYPDIDYILFLDSDDMIDSNYLKKMYKALDGKTDILESRFFIKNKLYKYDSKYIREGVCGSCIKASLIGDLRFNEGLCIGEDSLFMRELLEKRDFTKKLVETNYYYNLGDNINSLWMRYQRHEINKKYIWEDK